MEVSLSHLTLWVEKRLGQGFEAGRLAVGVELYAQLRLFSEVELEGVLIAADREELVIVLETFLNQEGLYERACSLYEECRGERTVLRFDPVDVRLTDV